MEKKEEIWLSPMTKAHTPTEKYKKQNDNTKHHPELRLCNRTIADQLSMVSRVKTATQLVW